MNPTPWRLMIHPPARGDRNMAVDEAILEAAREGRVPPTLRLYAWEPACLSLGYAQSFGDVDLAALHQRGWHVVRRPTGGRAILHTDELTYSVTGPQDEPRLAGSVLESYRRLSAALLEALHRLNLPAEVASPRLDANPGSARAALHGPVCFEVPSDYEIVAGGKKLIGSAQARRKGGVLQHGSLPLYGDLTRIVQVLAFPGDGARSVAANRLLERATTAESVSGRVIPWQAAAEAFVAAFEQVLDLELAPGDLTADEISRAEELVREKYGHVDWTERV
ncbi:MAG: lipoate--protein ligase family protein [Chloroflexota bacterium]